MWPCFHIFNPIAVGYTSSRKEEERRNAETNTEYEESPAGIIEHDFVRCTCAIVILILIKECRRCKLAADLYSLLCGVALQMVTSPQFTRNNCMYFSEKYSIPHAFMLTHSSTCNVNVYVILDLSEVLGWSLDIMVWFFCSNQAGIAWTCNRLQFKNSIYNFGNKEWCQSVHISARLAVQWTLTASKLSEGQHPLLDDTVKLKINVQNNDDYQININWVFLQLCSGNSEQKLIIMYLHVAIEYKWQYVG